MLQQKPGLGFGFDLLDEYRDCAALAHDFLSDERGCNPRKADAANLTS